MDSKEVLTPDALTLMLSFVSCSVLATQSLCLQEFVNPSLFLQREQLIDGLLCYFAQILVVPRQLYLLTVAISQLFI